MEILAVLLFGMPGGFEWLIIIFVILLLFGAKKIPELARGVGRGIREFNDAKNQLSSELEDGMKTEPNQKKENN